MTHLHMSMTLSFSINSFHVGQKVKIWHTSKWQKSGTQTFLTGTIQKSNVYVPCKVHFHVLSKNLCRHESVCVEMVQLSPINEMLIWGTHEYSSLSVCPSFCLSVCLSILLSVRLSVNPSFSLPSVQFLSNSLFSYFWVSNHMVRFASVGHSIAE